MTPTKIHVSQISERGANPGCFIGTSSTGEPEFSRKISVSDLQVTGLTIDYSNMSGAAITNANALYISDTGSSGVTGINTLVNIGSMSNGASYNYALNINNITGASSGNYAIQIGTVSGSSAANYGIKIGDVSGSSFNNFAIYTGLGSVYFGGSLTVAGSVSAQNNIYLTGSSADQYITTLTTDGSDNKSVIISSTSGLSSSRGAYIGLYGNEHNPNTGKVLIEAGNVTGGDVVISANGATQLTVPKTGGVTVANLLTASSGISITTVGLTVVAGGIGITLGNLTVSAGETTLINSATGTVPLTVKGFSAGQTANIQEWKLWESGATLASLTKDGLFTAATITSTGLLTASNALTITTGNLTVTNGNIVFSAVTNLIGTDSIGSTKQITLTGASTLDITKSGYISVYGNTHANTGQVIIEAGDITGGDVYIKANNATAISVFKAGTVTITPATTISGALTASTGITVTNNNISVSNGTITASGQIQGANLVATTSGMTITGNSTLTGTASGTTNALLINTGAVGQVGLTLKRFSASQTANILNFTNSSDVVLSFMDLSARLCIGAATHTWGTVEMLCVNNGGLTLPSPNASTVATFATASATNVSILASSTQTARVYMGDDGSETAFQFGYRNAGDLFTMSGGGSSTYSTTIKQQYMTIGDPLLNRDTSGYLIQMKDTAQCTVWATASNGGFATIDSSTVGTEALTDPSTPGSANWGRTADFALDGTKATYTHSTGAGTLTQANAKFTAGTLKNDRWYQLSVTIANVVGSPKLAISSSGTISGYAVYFNVTAGTQTIRFKTGSNVLSANFVLSGISTTTASFDITAVSLKEFSNYMTLNPGYLGGGGSTGLKVDENGYCYGKQNLTSTAVDLPLVAFTHSIVTVTVSGKTITLPTAVGITGYVFYIDNASTGNITLATTSSQTINGVTTQTLSPDSCICVISNGANWRIL